MREAVHQGESEEDSDSTHASADAARLHAVARRIQLREHASRQQQLQLHKQLQQQQQLLQQQQQQLHQQDALLRHQEQLLRQQEQQLASRETEAGLLLRQVSLLQQQLEERADRLAAAEGNYLDVTASLQQLQQRVALGDEARLLVEEVRQQQQQDTQHLYAEVRRLRRQLSHRIQLAVSSEEDRGGMSSRDREADLEKDGVQRSVCSESPAQQMATGGGRQQPPSGGLSLPPRRTEGEQQDRYAAGGLWCCVEAAESASCTAWGCSASCCCSSDDQHEAMVGELRTALHSCSGAMENRLSGESARSSAAAAEAAVLAVQEVLNRCPATGADPEIVGMLLERLRAESMQIRVYSQQRHAASSSMATSSTELQVQHQGGLASIDESMEREAYDVLGTALCDEVLLPLLAVQNISSLLRLKQQGVLLANSRWLQLLKETVGSKFLEGSCCLSSNDGSSRTELMQGKKSTGVSPQGSLTDNVAVTPAESWETRGEGRQHVLLQLLLRGSGGVAAAAGLLRHGTAPLALHAATLTDRSSGNNVFHLICLRQAASLSLLHWSVQLHCSGTPSCIWGMHPMLLVFRNLPQLFGTLSLTSLPCELLYAQNRQGKTPADLLPLLLPAHLQHLSGLQKAAAAGEMHQRAEFQEEVSGVSCNLRAWRSVVFEYAAKASSLYRQHHNEAALALYTEALKLQQRLLEKQQQLDEVTGGVSSSNLSLMENTAKLAFNKGRSALRLGRWICSLQSCSLCLSMTPNYKAAYETAAEACEWLLDFEGALNYMQLMRQHCPDSFAAEHYQKRRLYEAQLHASSFQVLGIERGAPKAAVNRAFRRMSILWHPDKASALSEDLRLRHENHFKRLNEARITLLDAESYARQLLLPNQPLYRHPELLVVSKPVQQSTPSPTLVQPEQLTTEQQQHDTHQQNDQQQGQESRQCEADEAEPRIEKLQQQRQQLLRSIGSLQRQQHELQRELEEHQAAAAQQSGWSSTSNSLRWHELQKLQQQQQNKQKRLIECETEIGEWLHRKQKQNQELQQQPLSQQPQEQSKSSQDQQQQRGDSQSTEKEKVEGSAMAAAAEVINEAAAAALSGRDQAKPDDDSPSWDSATSSDSDTDSTKAHSVFEGYGHTCGNSSSGFPTATTAVPTPPPLRRVASASTQQRRSSSEIPPSRTSPSETTRAPNAGRAREYSCATASRLSGRCGSRASSAGPQIRTGEAAITATATTPAATARAVAPSASSSTTKSPMQPRQQQLPSPPPRRVAATQGVRKDSSRSSSAGSGGCKTKGTSGRRRFVRTRGYLQQQQGASQQQRHEQQEHQEQPQRRQQLWGGTVGGSEATGSTPQTQPASATVPGGSSSDATPQAAAAAAAAWLLPPDFPEPFGAEGRPPQHQADDLGPASGHMQQQQQQRSPQRDYPDPEGLVQAVRHQQNEGTREQTLVDSPAVLSQSLDGHRMRQQRLQQDIQQQHMLHREMQQHKEMQATGEADRRQLLFPDEDLPTFPTNEEATETDKPAVCSQATATAGRTVPTTQAEEPTTPHDGRWASSEENPLLSREKSQQQRNPRWPVPPNCRNAVAEADSHPAHSLHVRRGALPTDGTPAETSGGGQGAGIAEMHQPSNLSGAASAGESCGSSSSDRSADRPDRRGSTSRNSSSDSEAENPADSSRAPGHWMPPIYTQHKRNLNQQEQEQGHLYHSMAQDNFPQQTQPSVDGVGPSHWGLDAPQRSSVPSLGCSSGGINEGATLRIGTGVPTATPTRLFPQYDPSDMEMHRSAQGVSLTGTHETSCSVRNVLQTGGAIRSRLKKQLSVIVGGVDVFWMELKQSSEALAGTSWKTCW
ncbi:LOW QUALITY PROTEIN: DnaJ domain-containing protein, putative [Eimeria mitis]|uniref:DnaJ domain-containing protein, putative n=1 Tax=Eimeria mitis TaxID=44415 RepID=U6KJC0_9EIME|nr:LOW QUALITY PROTEIN: DnaJ domain-containing protein, putative [Eimeria mitis]CDJ36337.1 DnaJ domain-containing protein, putative [Eimeria mitis]